MSSCDLNEIFLNIGRFSAAHDEGKYFDVLRLSPAVTVISGGQSGIDSAGLKAASFLGLPAFAIMPSKGRREGEPIESYAQREHINLRKIELATDSYRFRTYANVYYGDVTIIFDFVGGSEGTACTIQACKSLGRPYLVLTDLSRIDMDDAETFLLSNAPSVINIAGNSLSKITKQIEDKVYYFLLELLKKYGFLRLSQQDISLSDSGYEEHITVAIPNFCISKDIFKDFFKRAYNVDINYSKKLVMRQDKFTLILARPREIIRLVRNGVDVGFVGQDLCEEYSYDGDILMQTGLIPNSVVYVSKKDTIEETDKVCSQYPVFAEKLLRRSVTPITGSAEAYLGINVFDACVDSYQTGDTAVQNNLHVLKKLSETALVMLGNKKIKESSFYIKFVQYLKGLI